MGNLITVVLYTSMAGAAIPLGGALASVERLHPRWLEQELRHGVLAFGGGVLLAAVALVLIPEGTRHLSALQSAASLLAGGVVFLLVDRALTRRGTPASNLMAALLDFAPEAIALGALITAQPRLGLLLALFIGMQNLPEGFNAYRELVAAGQSRRHVLLVLTTVVLLGPVCGLLGLWLLSDTPWLTGAIMTFASGGILYLMFQDIAPQARLTNAWGPPLGAVLGFCLGVVGNQLLGH